MDAKLQELTVKAYAKLNLSLDITGKREDGYHLMDMVTQSVTLYDELTLVRSKKPGIAISTMSRFLPRDERNSAYKAAVRLARYAGLEPSLEIHIKKRIPTQAGMGGGSADAAAVLAGLNEMWELGLDEARLLEIGESVGADVPFCLTGGAARVKGIGELLEPLPALTDAWFVVMMPPHGHSTRELFSRFDGAGDCVRPDTDKMVSAMVRNDVPHTAVLLKNVFETFEKDETTARYKALLLKYGALGASLTGTGAAVFGVFADGIRAKECRMKVAGKCRSVYLVRGAAQGLEVTKRKYQSQTDDRARKP